MISKVVQKVEALSQRLNNSIKQKQHLLQQLKDLDNSIIETSGALREMKTFHAELSLEAARKATPAPKKAATKGSSRVKKASTKPPKAQA